MLGSDATDFFCGAVGSGSNLVRRLADAPLVVVALLAALGLIVAILVSRTPWRPGVALRLARRRSWGQTVTSAFRMYAKHPLLFLGIGLVTIPISVLVTLLQSLLVNASTVVGVPAGGEGGGFRIAVVVGAGTVLTLLGLALVQAASARAMAEIDDGRAIGVLRAYRLSLDSLAPMIGALAIAVTAVTLLSLSIFLVPIALVVAVRWALLVPCAELEERRALGALRRSGSLVRHQWGKVLSLVVFAAAIVVAAGPVFGAILLLVTSLPYAWINIVAGISTRWRCRRSGSSPRTCTTTRACATSWPTGCRVRTSCPPSFPPAPECRAPLPAARGRCRACRGRGLDLKQKCDQGDSSHSGTNVPDS